MPNFEIYTDGSCKGHFGSWSFIITQNGKILRESSGRESKTDCNRMEFQAAIEALRSLTGRSIVTLHTDSKVLLENVNLLADWESNGWIKKNGRPIPNVDLYKVLHNLIKEHIISWNWVRAHSGNQFNERCDELCTIARA